MQDSLNDPDKPRRLAADDPAVGTVLALIQRSFASMDGRVDPPSSMHRLTIEEIARQCDSGEVWAIGDPPRACVFLSPRTTCLYVGKLAVDSSARRQGLARQLIQLARDRAQAQGLPVLELETRIELTENRATFERLGFTVTGQGAHSGYDRPTFLILQRPV